MTLDDLMTQRAALVAARGSGALRTSFMTAGVRREVEYRSIAEISAAISAIDGDIAALSGTRVRTITIYSDKDI